LRRLSATILLSLSSLAGQSIKLTEVARGLSLLTEIVSAPDGSGRLFVARQHGLISVIQDGFVLPEPFLDIRSLTAAGGERGLIGLAFSPLFAVNGAFYVTYVTPKAAGETIVARYRVPRGSSVADPSSAEVILRLSHTFEAHYGGTLRFGPDGFLYIGLGDGGSPLDEEGNAQNPDSLFGKIARIDVATGDVPYRVPETNPFLNLPGFRPEIWALGLRNPWKFSFDSLNGDLYIGDVGQAQQEEIDFQAAKGPGGANYGWAIQEGLECANGPCPHPGLTDPIHAYGREEGGSVTGGFVYRGRSIPEMEGLYVYGDFVTSRIWA
jgi:glucose/arabinose dehydrogenase